MGCQKIPYHQEVEPEKYPPLKICKGIGEKEGIRKKCIDYYPFGLTMSSTSYQREGEKPNAYLFNGVELQEDLDLNLYQTLFRMYDPALGRFLQIDQIDKEDLSSYAWVTNNPILYADPYGLDSVRYDDLPETDFNPDADVVILDEVVVESTYTGPRAEDSPLVQHALMTKSVDQFLNERASGAVEPFYFVPNPLEAARSMGDNLRRGELLMAAIAAVTIAPGGKSIHVPSIFS
jgi:RHS repeat-associated protein